MPIILGLCGALIGLYISILPIGALAFFYLAMPLMWFFGLFFHGSSDNIGLGMALIMGSILCVGGLLGFVVGWILGKWLVKKGRNTSFYRVLFGGLLIIIATAEYVEYHRFQAKNQKEYAITQRREDEERKHQQEFCNRPIMDWASAAEIKRPAIENNQQLTFIYMKMDGKFPGWYHVKASVVGDRSPRETDIEFRSPGQMESVWIGVPMNLCDKDKSYQIQVSLTPEEKILNGFLISCSGTNGNILQRTSTFPAQDVCPQ